MTAQQVGVGEVLLDFWVPGHPKTKGSLTGRSPRCRCCEACRGYVGSLHLSDTAASKRWRQLVAYRAMQFVPVGSASCEVKGWPLTGPVMLRLDFALAVEDVTQVGAGDLDKLERNVLDALKDAGVYGDDVQVTRIASRKRVAETLGDGPGVRIMVIREMSVA